MNNISQDFSNSGSQRHQLHARQRYSIEVYRGKADCQHWSLYRGASNLVIFTLPSPITQFTSGTARHCLYTYIDRDWNIDYYYYYYKPYIMQTSAVLRLECSLDCLSAPTYRYIAPRMIQRIILKFCGYVGCDDATNVSNFGYEPIKFNQLNQ